MKPAILLPAESPSAYLAARLYAAMGMSVLPCTGKKPALKHWGHLQSRRAAPETINLWQSSGLLENVGVICGAVSQNLVVMDLDGDAAWDAFDFQFPEFTNTYRVASGSGHGAHLYFYVNDLPPTTRVTGLSIGNIELRSNGAYVVAPPSIHPDSGKPYAVAYGREIAVVPDMRAVVEWIKSLIREKHGGNMPPPSNKRPIKRATAYGAVALRNEAEEVSRALPGERNARLYRAALKMGSLITDGKIGASEVERALLEAAHSLSESDGEAASLRTIQSGISRGMESSRERYTNRA